MYIYKMCTYKKKETNRRKRSREEVEMQYCRLFKNINMYKKVYRNEFI